jgi:putative transposase
VDKEHPCRHRLRLAGFDYSETGAYFVTICARNRQRLFGEIVEGQIRCSRSGSIVASCWDAIPRHFGHVALDAFVVMPNHVHGVLLFLEAVGAGHARPLQVVVGSFKSAASRLIGASVWQRNYWEHIIRSDGELDSIRSYIEDNPLRWLTDPENLAPPPFAYPIRSDPPP